MEDFYYHGLDCMKPAKNIAFETNSRGGLELQLHEIVCAEATIHQISTLLQCGAIFSQNNIPDEKIRQELLSNQCYYNGRNYISICKHINGTPKYKSSYKRWGLKMVSIILSPDLDGVIKPENPIWAYPKTNCTKEEAEELFNREERYSCFIDEYQIRDSISLDNMVGIGIPFEYQIKQAILYCKDIKTEMYKFIDMYYKIKQLLEVYGYNVPLYNVNTMDVVTNPEEIIRSKVRILN